MENDNLTVLVKFDGDGNPLARRTMIYRGIHHAECVDGTLLLHTSEYGLAWAFSPKSGWYEVEVKTPELNLQKPGTEG